MQDFTPYQKMIDDWKEQTLKDMYQLIEQRTKDFKAQIEAIKGL